MIKAAYIACAVLAAGIAGCGRQQAASNHAASVQPGSGQTASSTSTTSAGLGQGLQGGVAAFQARYRVRIMRADTDHDGRISQQEWVAWRNLHPGRGTDPVQQFQRYDTNQDGYVTPDEIDAAAAKVFARRTQMQTNTSARTGGGAPY